MGYIKIIGERCKSCGLCISVCRFELIRISEEINAEGYFIAVYEDEERKCNGCKICGEICPDIAIEVYR